MQIENFEAMKTKLLLLLLWLVSFPAFSQEVTDPRQAVTDLKDGVLVVRLRTRANKMAKLQELMSKESPGSPAYKRLAAELQETREEVSRENEVLTTAFHEIYRFSEVCFLADSLAPSLKSDNPPLPVAGRFYLVAGLGAVAYSEGASGDDNSLIVYDRNFNQMQRPFPAYTGVSTIRLLWKSFSLQEEEIQAYHYRKMVGRLNKKLFNYYDEVTKGE